MKIFMIFLLCITSACVAFAHPPARIDIVPSATVINITVTHPVKDPLTHYIKLIEVSLNGKKIIEQKFSLQTTAMEQRATYHIPELKKGDVVAVDADCNLYGDLQQTLTVQ
jgi:desulfoferrodoxin (superoxide reductase-like protein)